MDLSRSLCGPATRPAGTLKAMDASRGNPRRLRIFLRDFRLADATANMAEGQSLTSWFTHRRTYVTLLDVHWSGTAERADVAILRVPQILYACAVDAAVPVMAASAAPRPREVEIQAEGGLLFRGMLPMLGAQRLADYLEAAGGFVPLLGARLMRSGRRGAETNVVIGDMVLNQEGIQAVREARVPSPSVRAEMSASKERREG